MNRRQRAIFWVHLCSGVVGGVVIFIMCVTGALLSFEKNIIEFAERDQRYVTGGSERLPVSRLLDSVLDQMPEARPSSIALQNDPAAAVTVAMGRGGREVLGVSFATFVAPGLIMMGMMQNAFANSSFSLLAGKIQGTIIDLLMPPLTEAELMIGIVAAAVTRALRNKPRRDRSPRPPRQVQP